MSNLSVQRDNRTYLCIGYEDGVVEIRSSFDLVKVMITIEGETETPVRQTFFPCSSLYGVLYILYDDKSVIF